MRFLVIGTLKYDTLLSREAMRELRLNLHHDDTISFGECFSERRRLEEKREVGRRSVDSFEIKSVEDIRKNFPGVVSQTPYPEPIKRFSVPFILRDTTPVCRKPYTLSRAKLQAMEEELKAQRRAGIDVEFREPMHHDAES